MNTENEDQKIESETNTIPKDKKEDGAGVFPDMDGINRFFQWVVLIALSIIVLQGIANGQFPGVMLLWAGACMAVGATVGFLFALTKVDQTGNNIQNKSDSSGVDDGYKPQINNNLIEISDWLTKIIVGLGLINLKEIPSLLKKVALVLAGCTGNNCGLSLAIATIVGFTVIGFLAGYLNTRTVIALMLDAADRQVLRRKVKQLEKRAEKSETEKIASDVVSDSRLQVVNSIIPAPKVEIASDVQSVDAGLARLAEAYESIKAPSYQERVNLKNRATAAILKYVLENRLTKQSIAAWVEQDPSDGLIIALAAYILAAPQNGDLPLLLKVARQAKWLHVKYRITLAFRELYKYAFGAPQEWSRVFDILADYNARAKTINDRSLASLTEEVMTLIRSNLS